jgi:PAS domain S-box-containing protein
MIMSKTGEEYQIGDVDTYHLIVDLAEEGIWILNPDDALVFINKKLLSMLGYSKEELLGHSFYDLVADPDKDTVKKALARRHKGVKETYVTRLKKKDSSLVWVAVAAAPIIDKQGDYHGTVSMALDITQVKQSEDALEKEKSMANMYLDIMAHDINNLNQVAIGNLELAILELQEEKSGSREIFDFLQKSLDTMCQQTALINNVKTLQRLKTEQLRYEEIDLGEIIAESVRECHNAPGREVTIEYKKPGKCLVNANQLLK